MKKNIPTQIKEIKDINFEDAEYSVFDFETTGTSASLERVIEIGIAKVKKGKIVDTFQSLINPGRHIPYHITMITGITNEDVKDAPYFEEVISNIKDFFGTSVLVAHHLNFDYAFLKNECQRASVEIPVNPAICTLKLARRIYPQLQSKSLGNLTKSLKIKHRNIHRGLGDATATAKILIHMFKQIRDNHDLETVSDLVHFQNIPSGTPFKLIKKKIAEDFSTIPSDPGIYFFRDAKGNVIYIGKAKSLKQRVSNYFLSNSPRKTRKIIQRANRLEFLTTNSELTALISEAELIKAENPKLNTLLKKFSRSYFLRINKHYQSPKIEMVTKIDFDGNDYYGPYPNRETTKVIHEIIDKSFELRECTEKEFSKKRKCYLADIERCFAPCIDLNITSEINQELEKINEFLCGHNQAVVDRLLFKMKELSEKKKYEEAAQTRDLVNTILMQLHKASILSEPVNKAKVLIEISGYKKNDFLLLIDGKMYIKNSPSDKNHFDDVLNDFFDGGINLYNTVDEKDLERLRITLSWLIKNKSKIKVHYLSQYSSIEELGRQLFWGKNKDNSNTLNDVL